MTEPLIITRGANRKPAATEILVQCLQRLAGVSGQVYTGYPLIAAPEGKYSVDATLVSPDKGIVLFDVIEGTEIGEYAERQDDLANKIEARLRLHRELLDRRNLIVPVSVISFAPAVGNVDDLTKADYPLVGEDGVAKALNELDWPGDTYDLYRRTLSAIESLSGIRTSRSKRGVSKPDSRGARLERLEASIATLDHRQNRAVIETVDGVQRIRGLAGSGKTIVLALKAAYLHTQHPDWRIAVTFHTRSLKGQFRRLINHFCIEQSGEEPDWTKIRVVNAWGAPGSDERDGIYYEYCRATGAEYFDFRSAATRFGGSDQAFDGACYAALASISNAAQLYDAILADEAQDFPSSFLRLCYAMLRAPKRLVYAYDELQNLSGTSLPPPEEIFGEDDNGRPLVTMGDDARRDVILQKCYRNSRPVLVTAHGLGFGIYRAPPSGAQTGLIQMFDYLPLWEEIGYRVQEGRLAKGERVVLARTADTSPEFLERASDTSDDLVQFIVFASEQAQREWLVREIRRNIEDDELRHDDIIVIHPEPMKTREHSGPIRKQLFEAGIQTHLAGVDTVPDTFFRSDTPSVTFTGIFRAKGNEAGMVYVINAQDCNPPGVGLANVRNRLFTAITRSKAWVRVLGYGPRMQDLVEEFQRLKQRDFVLDFVYPDDETLARLRIVHRDMSEQDKMRLERQKSDSEKLLRDLQSGVLNPEDLDPEVRDGLRRFFGTPS